MGKLKPFGLLLGLAGNVAIGFALFHLMRTGSCGGYGMPACPDDLTPWVLALPVGIMVSVVSIFLGGGVWVFTGVFLAVGLGSMASSAFGDSGELEAFGWIFGGAFTVFGLLPLGLYLAARPVVAHKATAMASLVATGGRAVGTVTTVRDTGVTVDRFPVWYDRKDEELWAYGTDIEPTAAPEVQDLFDRATAPDPPRPATDTVDQLTKLNDLRMSGALTDEEFTAAKDRLLGVTP